MIIQPVKAALISLFQSPALPFENGGVVDATRILDCHCILGECILYDDLRNSVVWTDIAGKQFHSLHLDSGDHKVIDLPKILGAFALRKEGDPGILCAWEDGFQFYDVDTGKALGDMSLGEEVNPKGLPTRLNDGRVDPSGKKFICGGFYGDVEGNYMKVFRVEVPENNEASGLIHEPIIEEVQVTNSICFSPNGKTMYFADSPTRTICKYDYEQGVLSNKQTVKVYDVGVPDGSCTDSNGNIWNAVWRNGAGPSMVLCINPNTCEIIHTVRMPDETSQVTCCCFGGPDLDILFISTAHINLDRSKEPGAGCVYAVKLGVKGCAEKRFGA